MAGQQNNGFGFGLLILGTQTKRAFNLKVGKKRGFRYFIHSFLNAKRSKLQVKIIKYEIMSKIRLLVSCRKMDHGDYKKYINKYIDKFPNSKVSNPHKIVEFTKIKFWELQC